MSYREDLCLKLSRVEIQSLIVSEMSYNHGKLSWQATIPVLEVTR